jgi:polysaccharide export outer membrane protein
MRRRLHGIPALLALLLWLSGCGGGPELGDVGSLPEAGGVETAVELPEVVYRLGPNDKIRVIVFRHEDLSGEFSLDGTGSFSMPLIGEVRANGMTARELEQHLEARFADGYLVEPRVSVEILTYRPFYILGEVNRPGAYEYENGMTVLNAVARAGGFSYRAKQDIFLLQRGGANAKPVPVTGNTRIAPGDVITVQERFF